MEAIILAGGLGTRLRSVVKDLPKPMADICGRPFLSYLMDHLSAAGVDRALLSVGYRHEAVMGYFGHRYKDMPVEYVIEEKPLGTGGAIREALKSAGEGDFLVLNGDTFFNLSIEGLFRAHLEKRPALTLSLKPMRDFDRYGSVVVEDGMVKGFMEKAFVSSGYINAGVYAVNSSISRYLQNYGESFSFEADFLQKKADGLKVAAFASDAYFIDIGIPEDYAKAQRELKTIQGVTQ